MGDEGVIKKNDEDVKNVHDIVSRKVSTGGKPADKAEEILFQAYNDGHEFARILYAQMLAENCPDEALKRSRLSWTATNNSNKINLLR